MEPLLSYHLHVLVALMLELLQMLLSLVLSLVSLLAGQGQGGHWRIVSLQLLNKEDCPICEHEFRI